MTLGHLKHVEELPSDAAAEAPVGWDEVSRQLETLYSAVERLEALFPGRRFTLDGHLVGSLGEVIAAYMFQLKLMRASHLGCDARALDGRRVEIKFTQGSRVAIRHECEHLIVLRRPKGSRVSVVFNGPGQVAWSAAGKKASNGQRPISIKRLKDLDRDVPQDQRLPVVNSAPV